ncbi:MAG: NUDIX hydrolase [Porticoccaceae bacterium]|nr:NUDIX hydrolase [Porticoccaceae bacterium]
MQPRQVFSAYPQSEHRARRLRERRHCIACGVPCATEEIAGGLRYRCPACGATQYRNPAPAVAVLIADRNRFVLGRRQSRSLGHGLWCLPCGYIEYEEDHLSAAVREVREETALEVRIDSILSVVTNYLQPEIHSLVTVLAASVTGGELQAGDGLTEVRWFTYTGQFPDMAFAADTHIISRFFETNLRGAPVDPVYARPGAAHD